MFIVKVPGINGLGKTKGCELAGDGMIRELRKIYTNQEEKIIDVDSLDLEEIHLDNSNLELSADLIYKNSLKSFETKPKIAFLGGDHSISYHTTKAFMDYCKNAEKEPCLIVFDAHPDCMKPVDNNFPTHEEWLRGLIEAGFPTKNILLVGSRNSALEERRFMKENKIRAISMSQFVDEIGEVCDVIMEFSDKKELYISIDIDSIDPAFAPSTGYPEPGGFTSKDFLYLVQRLNKIKNLRAMDIVEINAEKDKEKNNLTLKLGAKILSEFI
ncbi:MAG: arginase family protein [Candidatus Pacearchaeota archaeon]